MSRTADQIRFDDGERFARKEALFRLRQQEVAALRKIASSFAALDHVEQLKRRELVAKLTAFIARRR